MTGYTELCQFFGVKKTGGIRFAHAVNSRSLLEESLRDPIINILEGDVSVAENGQIIMAHPPSTTSDLKFADWLTHSIKNGKGVKLDFKVPEVVEPCLAALNRTETDKIPIFLNAEILQGPGGDPSPFDPDWFIKRCSESFPGEVLSVGWKTRAVAEERYTIENVEEMLNLLTDWRSLVTFPVRACYVKSSWQNLKMLLESPTYSLTLWNNEPVEPDLLGWVKASTDPARTFYDLINPDGSTLPI